MNDRNHVTNLTLGSLAASFIVCTAVWVGAQLAARLFGSGHWLDVDLADALHAVLRLGAHLESPRRAWSATVERALPGPVGYWTCTIIVLLFRAELF